MNAPNYNASNYNAAARGFRGWWASPPRRGLERLINPVAYRHLRSASAVHIAGGSVAAAVVVLTAANGGYGWAVFFLVVAAVNFAVAKWYITIARSRARLR